MSYYISRLYDFLRELQANNNREWFAAHKEEYDSLRSLWLDDVERLIGLMSQWEPQLRALKAKDCVYRIYRDTRFSTDKTPYKVYFSAAFSPWGRKTHRAAYYMQMDVRDAESGLYGGVWCPDAPLLRKLRNAIVDNIEEFREIIDAPDMKRYYPGWISESLKSAPKGWPKDHPDIDLLRLKDYGKFCRCDEKFFDTPDWPAKVAERVRILKPMVDFLNYSIDEEI